MKLAAAASWIHKWLALLIGVQILFWFASGLFFAIYPIERVRSEHRIAEHQSVLAPREVSPSFDIASRLPEAPAKVTFERMPTGEAVAVAEFAERLPVVVDLTTGRVLPPLDADAATRVAQSYIADSPPVREARLITTETPEYRGALPAWRIAFEDSEGLAVYVAANTGRVTARRSDLWRLYDALWALHIMDWRDHENFNTGLLILATALALIVTFAGFVLIPYRMGWVRRRGD
jgi:uncharacterized iron-regulated membrane protein